MNGGLRETKQACAVTIRCGCCHLRTQCTCAARWIICQRSPCSPFVLAYWRPLIVEPGVFCFCRTFDTHIRFCQEAQAGQTLFVTVDTLRPCFPIFKGPLRMYITSPPPGQTLIPMANTMASTSTRPVTTMSPSTSNFQLIFNSAVKAYERRTKTDILAHPLASQLQACNSPSSIIDILQGQMDDLAQVRTSDEKLTKWLDPTINVLFVFSGIVGEGVSLVSLNMIPSWDYTLTASSQVFSPATVIFAGAGVLLQVCIFLDISLQSSLTRSTSGS